MRVAVAITMVCLASAPVRAGDDTITKVRALFDSGTTHYNLGEYRASLGDFTEAYRLKHDAAFLFNIGQAHRQLGEPEEASRAYRAYLREAPNTPNRPEVEKFIVAADATVAARRAAEPPTGIEQPKLGTTPAPEAPPTAASPIAAVAPPAPVEAPRSRTGLWVTIGVVAVVLIAASIALGVGLSRGPSEPATRFGTLSVFQ